MAQPSTNGLMRASLVLGMGVMGVVAASALGACGAHEARDAQEGAQKGGKESASAAASAKEGAVNAASGPEGAAAAKSPLDELRAFEAERRKKADFASVPASDKEMGADPYLIRRAPGTSNFVAIARGDDAVLLLDSKMTEIARAPAPASPTGLAVTASGDVFVSGELSKTVARLRIKGASLVANGSIRAPDRAVIRDIAVGPEPGVLYAADERDGKLITFTLGEATKDDPIIPSAHEEASICSAAAKVARVGAYVMVDCILDHELVIRSVNTKGIPVAEGEARIKHDGPIWSFDAAVTGADGSDLLIAAGGVEDHPLDRTEGSFGFIDSFVYVYRFSKGSPAPAKIAEVNVSTLGVVTPKALLLTHAPEGVVVEVTGYGGDRRAKLVWAKSQDEGALGDPNIATTEHLPGTTSMAEGPGGTRVYSNTLLDAFVIATEGADKVIVPVARPSGAINPDAQRKLGEALFFTSLMAPWNKTEGRLSRFTCETCHFEGYIDGRTHHTGRGDVHATTKPLLGLFNNRPHFSRALDPDLSSIAHNEFRVAGANSGHDPWFSLKPAERPLLLALGVTPADANGDGSIGPSELRLSLMAFLMGFTHRPNPSVVGRNSFSDLERAGAEVFRDHCEGCHSARLSADEPSSRAPFERWESLVMSREGPIVWGENEYKKTGVEPYVHDQGARVPSLRRLYKKRPYFTNGSAKKLSDVLERARLGPEPTVFFHDKAPPEMQDLRGLDERERAALLAFLELL